MNRRFTPLPIALLAVVAATARAEPYAGKPGPHEAEQLQAIWKDAARDREVPVMICYPKDLAGMKEPLPVIIFSHGLGGNLLTYAAYGKHWASHGYVVIFVQHHGSDTAGLLSDLLGGTRDDVKSFMDRVGDVRYVLDQADKINAGKLEGKQYDAFKGKLDLSHIGMAGHSFGAITTDAVAGQTYWLAGKALSFTDKRITAGIAMSPFPPFEPHANLEAAYGSIKIPLFYLTGNLDNLGVAAESRRAGFDHSKVAGTDFVSFKAADHFTFAPLPPAKPRTDKAAIQKLILESTTAFWDSHLKGDKRAAAWLANGFAKELGTLGKFEQKK